MPQLDVTEHKKKRGQATVELALALLFLVLLLVGVADVARIYSEQLDAVHAAGVAARWKTLTGLQQYCSARAPSSAEGIATVVARDLGQSLATEVTGITVETPVAAGAPAVTVKVTYHHEFLFGIIQGVSGSFVGASTMPGVPSEIQFDPNCPAGVTPGPLPTSTNTPIPTNTPTITPTPTNTPSYTPTNTPLATNTPTNTPIFTNTPTNTPNAQTQTAVAVATQTAAAGATQTAVVGATQTAAAGATQTAGVQATQTAAAGATQTAGVQATQTAVADFTLSANPAATTIPRGTSGTSTITVTSLGGFNGTVALTASILPDPNNKVHTTINPASVLVTPITPGSATLTIVVDNGASRTNYTITITGTSGAKSHTTTVTLTVP